MTTVTLPQAITLEKQPQITETINSVTVRRMVHGGGLSLLVVTDELGTLDLPLTQEQYGSLSTMLQSILIAHLASQAL